MTYAACLFSGRSHRARTDRKEYDMLKKIRDIITEKNMIAPGERLILGLSGGRDSVCLFHVLRKLGPEMGFSFFAVHVNHGIRGEEALRDEEFADALCRQYGIPLRIVRASVPELASEWGLSLEEAGRHLRRRVFEEECVQRGAQKIALAHHKNDMAETVLFNIARGSGIGGLSSLRPVRGPYIRPLLGVTRDEIDRFLTENGYPYVEDSSNGDVSYSRNRIRNDILPMFTQFVNARTVEHLAGLSETSAKIADFLMSETGRCISGYARSPGKPFAAVNRDPFFDEDFPDSEKQEPLRRLEPAGLGSHSPAPGDVLISGMLFEREAEILIELTVRETVGSVAGRLIDIDRRHVEAILGLYGRKEGKKICLPYNMEAVRVAQGILIRKIPENENPAGLHADHPEELKDAEGGQKKTDAPVPLQIPGVTVDRGIRFLALLEPNHGETIPQNMYTKWFDYDKIKGILEIRRRKKGDYIVINPSGNRKKFSDFLIDRKIPRAERDEIPLICVGSEVLWAPGIRSGESCRVDEETKCILKISAESMKDAPGACSGIFSACDGPEE